MYFQMEYSVSIQATPSKNYLTASEIAKPGIAAPSSGPRGNYYFDNIFYSI